MSAQASRSMGLFGLLPLEIRNMVYRLHVPSFRDEVLVTKPKPEFYFPSLVLASKALCAEIKPMIDTSRGSECNMEIHLCRKHSISFTNGLMLRPGLRDEDDVPQPIMPPPPAWSLQAQRYKTAKDTRPRHFFKMPLPMPDLQAPTCTLAAIKILHINIDVQRQRWDQIAHKLEGFDRHASRLTSLQHLSIAFGRDDFRWSPNRGILDRSKFLVEDETTAIRLLEVMLASFVRNVKTLMTIEFPNPRVHLQANRFNLKVQSILEEVLSHLRGGRVAAKHRKVVYNAGEVARLGMCSSYYGWRTRHSEHVYWDRFTIR